MTYSETIREIKSYIPSGRAKWNEDYRLSKIEYFLNLLGNPHKDLTFIHVGGTSGKGSTASILSSILTESGYKTGLHVSPHVMTIRERMQINGTTISKERFTAIFQQIQPQIEKMIEDYGVPPSYFEILLAMAYIYFKEEACDLVVLEVGLGGKLDATNVIDCKYQIITNIGLDHTAVLGETKELILKDKQEIIKPNSIVVSGIREVVLHEILNEKISNTNSTLFLLDKDFKISNVTKDSEHNISLSFASKNLNIANIKLDLKGKFQSDNAALAIMMSSILAEIYSNITPEKILTGVFKATIPGRFQIFSTSPLGIIDGAHNPDKILALVASLKYLYPDKRFVTIFRYKKRNDIDQSLNYLREISNKIIITTSHTSGDMGPEPIFDNADKAKYAHERDYIFEADLAKAHRLATKLVDEDSGILVTGSLYMIAEYLNIVNN